MVYYMKHDATSKVEKTEFHEDNVQNNKEDIKNDNLIDLAWIWINVGSNTSGTPVRSLATIKNSLANKLIKENASTKKEGNYKPYCKTGKTCKTPINSHLPPVNTPIWPRLRLYHSINLQVSSNQSDRKNIPYRMIKTPEEPVKTKTLQRLLGKDLLYTVFADNNGNLPFD